MWGEGHCLSHLPELLRVARPEKQLSHWGLLGDDAYYELMLLLTYRLVMYRIVNFCYPTGRIVEARGRSRVSGRLVTVNN